MEEQERPATFGAGLPTRGWVADIPQPVKELKGAISGIYGMALREILDLMEVALVNDRQFEIGKRLVMNIFGEKERQMRAIVTRILVTEESRNGSGTQDAEHGTK